MNTLALLTTLLLVQPPAADTAAQQPAAADTTTVATEQDMAPTATPETESVEPAADSAQESASSFGDTISEIMGSGALGLLIEGGIFMWPILLLGIIGAGVIIERYRSLKMLATDSSQLRGKVQTMLLADEVEDALQYCDQEQGPVAAILSSGLRKFFVLRRLNYDADRIREQVVKAMDDYNIHIVAALERHLPILATIASVAPMLGFLGTVAGMIVSFDNIDTNFGNENIVKLAAGGIKVSLLTTAFGLIVGIPAFMAFNYFTSVIDRFVLDVEESATELIEAVTIQTAMDRAPGLQPPTGAEA